MAKVVKDGWHNIGVMRVYVEDGCCMYVLSPCKPMAGSRQTVARGCAYRKTPAKYGGGWDRIYPSLDALRAGLKRGTIEIRYSI